MFFPLLLMAFFVLFVPATTHAALEVQYPHIPGFGNPQDTLNTIFASRDIGFGDLFKFLFTLALWAVGFFVFGSLLIFGFIYETSGGNPAKKLRAKQRLQGVIIGLFILLGFTIILRAINPELATLGGRTFNVCANSSGINVCTPAKAPVIESGLTYKINEYKNTDANLGWNSCRSDALNIAAGQSHDAQTIRYEAAFNTTPGIAPCNTINGCSNGSDPRSIEFFKNNLETVLHAACNASVNPVFAVAVWRAGTLESDGNNSFGCTAVNAFGSIITGNTNVTQPLAFSDSLSCFTNSVRNSGNFVQWISNYCSPDHSDVFVCNNRPRFMSLLHMFYDDMGGSPYGLLDSTSQWTSTLQNPPITQPQW